MKNIICVFLAGLLTHLPTLAEEQDLGFDVIYHESFFDYSRRLIMVVYEKEIEKAPKWDEKDIRKVPLKSDEALNKATTYLRNLDFKDDEFHLFEISLVKTNRTRVHGYWYWKIVFVDRRIKMINVPALITIPVLMDGHIPKPTFEKIEEDE